MVDEEPTVPPETNMPSKAFVRATRSMFFFPEAGLRCVHPRNQINVSTASSLETNILKKIAF